MKITANKSVSVAYQLFVEGDNNGELELMEKASADHPMNFVYGIGMMLPKFEEHLFGLEKGENFEFTLKKEDAYGEYEDENVIDLDRSIFEIDGIIDEKIIFEGNVVPLMDNDGNRINAQIVSVTDAHVKVDLNHPLAGEDLNFKGSIIDVREASEKEIQALLGGGGCGGDCSCGSGGCDDCGTEEEHSGCGSSCGCH